MDGALSIDGSLAQQARERILSARSRTSGLVFDALVS